VGAAKDAAGNAVEIADGKVIDITGDVFATREGAKPRALKLRDDIFADDTVRTTEDSAVAILLAKNGAIYDLGDLQEVRIESSLAWSANIKSQGAFDPKIPYEGTSAAGVNVEQKSSEHASEVRKPDPINPSQAVDTTETDLPRDSRANETKTPTADNTRKNENSPVKVEEGLLTREWSRREKSTTPGSPDDPAAADAEAQLPRWPAQVVAKRRKMKRPAPANKSDAKNTKRAFVLQLARSCQTKSSGSGSFQVQITFADAQVSDILIKGPKALSKTLACLEEKLTMSTHALEQGTIIFSLTLLPLD
jgi:hypothetical protein